MYTVNADVLPGAVQSPWMLSTGVHSIVTQSGLVHPDDVRLACTQPPLLQSLSKNATGAQPAYTQPSSSQPLLTYTMGTQPASIHGHYSSHNLHVVGAPSLIDNLSSPVGDCFSVGNPHCVDSVPSANCYQTARIPQAGVPLGQSHRVASVPNHCLAACMPPSHTTNLHPHSSTHALTDTQHNWPVHLGLPPAGYPQFLEGSFPGSVHVPPLATSDQNYLSPMHDIDKRGQLVALTVKTDAEAFDSLLSGLPPPPTGPLVFRQSSMVPTTAATGSSMSSGQLYASSAAAVTSLPVPSQPVSAALVTSSVLAAAVASLASGQPTATTTVRSSSQLFPFRPQQQLVSRWCLLMSQGLCQLFQLCP